MMTEQQFKDRTKKMAVAAARLVVSLRKTITAEIYGKQLIRSASSVGCNYRAACRARSDAEMAAKLGISEEEGDESQYWLELLVESKDIAEAQAKPLYDELNEIVAILVASRRTLRVRIDRNGSKIRETRKAYNPGPIKGEGKRLAIGNQKSSNEKG
jgi:four helix bundle protein